MTGSEEEHKLERSDRQWQEDRKMNDRQEGRAGEDLTSQKTDETTYILAS